MTEAAGTASSKNEGKKTLERCGAALAQHGWQARTGKHALAITRWQARTGKHAWAAADDGDVNCRCTEQKCLETIQD
ncbi:uncharacterized protein LOC142775009 isoform X2 [Rhipicephalus microplus]|uniref:uncharacterized protein LOC142775009 isoform X2 n=1 Tax=Rhipicephalus microplus TaxID=6941 RepID=UPI003F6C576E